MLLISSIWGSPFGLESSHPYLETDLALSPRQWHLPWVLQPLLGSTKVLVGVLDCSWANRAMNRQLLLCDLRPPATHLWATLWRTCLPRSSSPCLN